MFVAAFDDEQRLVGQSALWSLRRMSGQDFEADAAAWRDWFGAELDWFETEGARWIQVLEDEDPARVIEAAGALSAHALFRHDTARALAPQLQAKSPTLAIAIAQVLGELGSPGVAQDLVRVLSADDEGLRKAAWSSLQRLTGKKLPLDPSAWTIVAQG
ncbi:MAG: HEAT repeat domain-containing protein [Planctomycetes bacterium]|nr:HEAT repeat domain-containing protein [Planctomycetota bacterium]